jgi:hypothetical protein
MEYAHLISSEEHQDRGVNRNYHAAGVGFGFTEHNHPWSHTITCTKGSLKITVDGVDTTITTSSETFVFPEKLLHSVEIMEDGTEFYTEHPLDLTPYTGIYLEQNNATEPTN